MENLPRHIAIIMDGNGRWARKRGLPRIAGHREGMKAVKRTVRACAELEIDVLTLYAFSTENWQRPKREVSALMSIFCEYINAEIDELMENGVKIVACGDISGLPKKVCRLLYDTIERTAENKGLVLNVALNYGGRDEIVRAVQKIGKRVKEGSLLPSEINEKLLSSFLDTHPLPDPDLLIRTSGQLRVSNFLLWQIAYTEIYITDVLWPDFTERELMEAIKDYQKRERRFGGI
jgi:undecaprenyl diphosphate synthase